jgi:hypothetical protein
MTPAAVPGKSWRSFRGMFKTDGRDGERFLEEMRADRKLEDAIEQEAAAKTAKRVAEGRRPFEGLRGALQNSGVFDGDPVEAANVVEYPPLNTIEGVIAARARDTEMQKIIKLAEKDAADPNRPKLSRLFGSHPGIFGGIDPVAYQRSIRDEWDD